MRNAVVVAIVCVGVYKSNVSHMSVVRRHYQKVLFRDEKKNTATAATAVEVNIYSATSNLLCLLRNAMVRTLLFYGLLM